MSKLEIRKLLQVLLGTSFISLAVTLLITAHKGADTISIFLLGILNIFDIPFWVASLLFNIIILCIVAIFNRKELGIGSFINGLGLGLLIGIFEPVMDQVSVNISWYPIFSILVAPILFGVGAGIYVSSNKGSAALEALTQLIFKHTNLSLKVIRMGLDATMVIVGMSLGAPIGIGTLICVVTIGPIFEKTMKVLNPTN
ncbi:YczE/YyaS/YitT family protein [Enterococcus sp. 5H]|uniref:YczE/YyaS/YitT family protein n=1 Tax=Enterococcus sp. 5H TaxID=1229490 RepID=UPI002303452B|nr:hypothetical protein [Enterococcus sp. 5H]MDA9470679.1 hypothetical protein [Enterococcus sp. 5H]